MTKTFHEILAENDDEYTYSVRSTVNIHDPERCERIRFAFLPYDIKSVDCEAYTPLSKDNKWFPTEPNSPTFVVKIITGLPVPESFMQTLAMVLHVHHAHLRIDGEEDIETDLVNEPEAIEKDYSQSLVGTKRIAEFVKELNDDRKEREKKFITREVYECYFTTHRGLAAFTKQPARNGYYMVQRIVENGNQFLEVEGPYVDRPEDQNLYQDRILASNPKIISETSEGGLHRMQILVDAISDAQIAGDRMYEVGVHDLESGRRFSATVSAPSPELARTMALKQVAEEHRLDPQFLSPLAPKETNKVFGNSA